MLSCLVGIAGSYLHMNWHPLKCLLNEVYKQGDHPRPSKSSSMALLLWLLAECWSRRRRDEKNLQCCKEQRDFQFQVRVCSLTYSADSNLLSSFVFKFISFYRNIFQSRTSTGFRDEHIWVSIVDPPSRSPFTRAQRVSCCMSLLLCTMAINIAFWNLPVDETSPVIFSFGDYRDYIGIALSW